MYEIESELEKITGKAMLKRVPLYKDYTLLVREYKALKSEPSVMQEKMVYDNDVGIANHSLDSLDESIMFGTVSYLISLSGYALKQGILLSLFGYPLKQGVNDTSRKNQPK